jgi:hypothetical protein
VSEVPDNIHPCPPGWGLGVELTSPPPKSRLSRNIGSGEVMTQKRTKMPKKKKKNNTKYKEEEKRKKKVYFLCFSSFRVKESLAKLLNSRSCLKMQTKKRREEALLTSK